MFSSESVKDNFDGKEAELRWTDENDKTYTYSVRKTGAPRRLLITLHSSPLIDDDNGINGISSILQKLFKYFNGTIISTSFVLSSLGVFPVIFILDLSDSESVKLLFGSSL